MFLLPCWRISGWLWDQSNPSCKLGNYWKRGLLLRQIAEDVGVISRCFHSKNRSDRRYLRQVIHRQVIHCQEQSFRKNVHNHSKPWLAIVPFRLDCSHSPKWRHLYWGCLIITPSFVRGEFYAKKFGLFFERKTGHENIITRSLAIFLTMVFSLDYSNDALNCVLNKQE